MRTAGQKGWVLAGIAGLLLSGGCAQNPYMAKARRTREQALARSVDAVTSLEDRRTEKLAQTAEIIRERYEQDTQATRKNAEIIRQIPAAEMDRWLEKKDAYEAAIHREFRGRPESIERTVPNLIY